jgi:hypothetical protein
MKLWIMAAILVGLFIFAGVVILTSSQAVQADTKDNTATGSCPYGAEGCPYKKAGGCTQGSNCGLDTCAAKYGGGCGCGGR